MTLTAFFVCFLLGFIGFTIGNNWYKIKRKLFPPKNIVQNRENI